MIRSRTTALVVTLACMMLTGCGSGGVERSPEAFCSTMVAEQERIRAQLDSAVGAGEATGDDFAAAIIGLGASIQALGELKTYFRKLEQVAPDEVRTEVEIVSEFFDEQLGKAASSAGDPLGSLSTALIGGLMISGPLDAVNSFAATNCGRSI